jgi:predicted DNA-binding transcriptional regulator AlpA
MKRVFKDASELPMTLAGDDVAAALNISRAGAYNLMKSEGFPRIRVGKRIMTPRKDFLLWMENNTITNCK